MRIICALKELGIEPVSIYSEPDKNSRHAEICESYELKGQPAKVYLDIAQIIEIAKSSGAQAIHPGYGFLSENAEFAKACTESGIKFIGPNPNVIAKMGSKIESRRAMQKAKVPVVPGNTDPVRTLDQAKQLALKYGYPVAIKASAGGGGRGLKVARSESELENALASAMREGASYFGSDEVYIEKYLDLSRHIEVQILADEHGNVINIGERDCSSQRRHQKLVEESPAPNLPKVVRDRLLEAAVRGATEIGYTSAGTFEFLVAGDQFYFLEANTRVQVEHPITEATFGIDIVKEQIRIAAGGKLSVKQSDLNQRGHAIEFRINAEDPWKNFLPSPGLISLYQPPQWPWVRIDSACYSGYKLLPFYDSLLAKLIIWGRDRAEAIARSKIALESFIIEGVSTTIPFHIALLQDEKFLAGQMDTKYVEAEFIKRLMQTPPTKISPGAVLPSSNNIEQSLRIQEFAPHTVQSTEQNTFEVELNQKKFQISVHEMPSSPRTTEARPQSSENTYSNSSTHITSQMPGLVKQVCVAEGETVKKGQRLLIFEAMKMESDIVATCNGQIDKVKVKAGDSVDDACILIELK